MESFMTEQSIISQDMMLKRRLQDFYRVPDYQREYVWDESDAKGDGGDQVEQFLADIYGEYENITKESAPEHFIGIIVVCQGDDELFDLIDGQQRTTTCYLTICAIRDALSDLQKEIPEERPPHLASPTPLVDDSRATQADKTGLMMPSFSKTSRTG
jgi:uncharacterized protein with ParB-like and HNH nuclease domain